MSKQLHTGKAALNGILSALLANKGFTGATKIFEGEKGFCKATSRDYKLEKLTQGLGEEFKIRTNSFKPHASCRHTHPAIDAALELVKKHNLYSGQVEKISVRTYSQAIDLLEGVEASTPYAAKFNLPFCLATTIKYQKMGLEAFTEERLEDKELKQLMGKIVIKEDKEITSGYPDKWTAIVEITDRQGKKFTARVEYPKGDSENPLTEEELISKFFALTGSSIGTGRKKYLVKSCLSLEKVRDMSRLFG